MWMVLLVSVLMSAGTTAGENYGFVKTTDRGNDTHSVNKVRNNLEHSDPASIHMY